jgi:hypothetical protein
MCLFIFMCVSVCLLEVNGFEEFCGIALCELCCNGGGAKQIICCRALDG